MTNEQRKEKYMNRNIKLCPAFLGISYDVIFVWTISTMYFTTQKGLSMSQTIVLDSILMFSGCLLSIPIERLFKNIKPLKASIIGNIGYAIFIIMCIFGTNFFTFAVAQIFLSFGYVVVSVKNNLILTQSLSVVHRDKEFNKVSGQGLAVHYTSDAIGAIIATYAYSWHPELAFWMSLAMVIISEIIGFCMKEPSKFQEQNIQVAPLEHGLVDTQIKKVEADNKSDSYIKVLASSFFVLMLIYMFFFRGANAVISAGFKMYLQEAVGFGAIPVWMYGYIYALFRLSSALSSKYQFKFDLKFGVRSLLILNVALVLGFVISGIVYLFTPFSILGLIIIILCNYMLTALRAPNQIFVNNYMQVCIAPKNIEKAYSIRTMVEYCGYASLNAIYSLLVGLFMNNYGWTSITFISIAFPPLVIALALFVRALVKKYAQKYTIIKEEYIND